LKLGFQYFWDVTPSNLEGSTNISEDYATNTVRRAKVISKVD